MSFVEVSAVAARERYRGDAALNYESVRQTRALWNAEQLAVSTLLDGVNGTVLDCPVGTGRFLPLYRSLGLDVIGIDINDEMLAQARSKDSGADLRIGDLLDLDLPGRSVDTSICVRLLNLISEAEMIAALVALCRVSRSCIILSIRLGEVCAPRGYSLTQRQSVFDETLRSEGWGRPVDRRELRSDGYAMLRLAPCA